MDLFQKLFGKKDNSVGIAARQMAVEEYKKIVKMVGLSNFKLQVGDDDGNVMDSLAIISSIRDNPDVKTFLDESLLLPHTSKNLMTLGFTKIYLIEKDNKVVQVFTLEKFAK